MTTEDLSPGRRIDALHEEADFLAAQARHTSGDDAAKLIRRAEAKIREAARIRQETER